jgi:hypothetical protein
MKISPFQFIASINEGARGKDLMEGITVHTDSGLDKDSPDKQYVPFIVNRGLSFFQDTVLFANEMNRYPTLHPKQQYDFLRHAILPRKRFSKWPKKAEKESDIIAALYKLYGYSTHKAESVLPLLNNTERAKLLVRVDKGGKTK